MFLYSKADIIPVFIPFPESVGMLYAFCIIGGVMLSMCSDKIKGVIKAIPYLSNGEIKFP
jgi:hypothetical protein